MGTIPNLVPPDASPERAAAIVSAFQCLDALWLALNFRRREVRDEIPRIAVGRRDGSARTAAC